MSVTFTKLFSSITASTIWAEPDHTRLVWITMLAMADQHGRVWASIPGLANMARVTLEKCEDALQALQSPDKYSRTKEHDGRRIEEIDGGWRLLNHAKYRAIRDEESIKESKRRYINARREAERAASSTVEGVEQSRTASKPVVRGRANTEAEAEAEDISSPTVKRYARKRAESVEVSSLVAAGFSEQSATDFIAHKSAKKAPLTARAWEDHKREAAKAGWTPMAAAEKVMARNWAGFEAKYVADDPKPGVSHQSFRERDAELASARVAEMTGGIGAARTKRNGVIDGCITEVGGEAVFPAGRALRVKVDEPLERP